MKGKILVIAAVLALVVPTAVSAKIGNSHGKAAPASSRTILAPAAKSSSAVVKSSRAVQHDGTCLSRASTYEL